MTEEMEKRLYDVICIAPWTELDLRVMKRKCKIERRKGEYKVRNK